MADRNGLPWIVLQSAAFGWATPIAREIVALLALIQP